MARRKTCPICKNGVDAASRWAPFCSERCKLIDLGNWLGEGYRIPDASVRVGDDDRGSES